MQYINSHLLGWLVVGQRLQYVRTTEFVDDCNFIFLVLIPWYFSRTTIHGSADMPPLFSI